MELLILFGKGLLAGFLYTFASLTSSLLVSDFVSKQSKKEGFLASLGITIAHTFWACIAAFILSLTSVKLSENQSTLTFIGSLIMFYFAYKIYKKEKKKRTFFKEHAPKSYKAFLSGLFFSLSSPGKMIGYTIIFATLNSTLDTLKVALKIPLIFGVFFGGCIYWYLFINFVGKRLKHYPDKKIRLLQKIAAFSMAFLGLIGLLHSLQGFR